MGPITVRTFRPEDADDLRMVYYQLYDERDAGEPVGISLFATRPSIDDERQWFERQYAQLQSGELIGLVAEVDGHAVGSCSVARHGPTADSEQGHAAELGILVRRDMRGRGVGTALLEEALRESRAKFEVVFLSVFEFNARAQRLYERFGFTVCGRLPRAVKRGGRYFDLIRMVRFLDEAPAGLGRTVKPPQPSDR